MVCYEFIFTDESVGTNDDVSDHWEHISGVAGTYTIFYSEKYDRSSSLSVSEL